MCEKGAQLRKCFHQTALKAGLWGIFLGNEWYGKTQPHAEEAYCNISYNAFPQFWKRQLLTEHKATALGVKDEEA